jgi:hypothetical protein
MSESDATISTESTTTEPTEKVSSGSDSADFEAWLAEGKGDTAPIESDDNETIDFSEDGESSDESEDVSHETDEETEIDNADDKIVLTIDGEEIEYDASDKERLARDLEHGLKSDKRYKEAKKLKTQALDLVSKIISNPEEVLTHPSLKEQGFDFREVAEKYLFNELQKERMTEQERRAYDNERELAKIKAEREEQQKTAAQRNAEMRQEQLRTSFTNQIIEAVDQAGLPKTQWTVSKIAEHMRTAIKKGYKDVTALDVAPLVANDIKEMSRQYISSLKDENLVEALGQDVVDKLRKQNLARVSNPFKQNQPAQPKTQLKNSQSKPRTSSSLYDLLDDVLK